MFRSPLLLALAASVAIAGCAGTSSSSNSKSATKFQGEQRLVANTVEDLETDAKPGRTDPGKICRDLLATALQRQFATRFGTCDKGVDAALKDADAYQLTVQGVRIAGSRATATVKVDTGDKDRVQSVALVKQGPSWRISRFG